MLQIKRYLDANDEWLNMVNSEAVGLPLVKDGSFAADMLKFERGQRTSKHTHPGNHILFVVDGGGWLVYGDESHVLSRGTCYFVPGQIPHQVIADEYMFMLSIANDHRPVDSPSRLEVIA